MLESNIVEKIHDGVCAIGYLPIPLSTWQKNPASHPFEIIGSGFMVRETTVITNRHVIRDLLKAAEGNDIPDSQLFISFIAPREGSNFIGTVRMIRRRVGVSGANKDVGFIEFQREPTEHFSKINPLTITESKQLHLTEEVNICGYAHANKLVVKNNEVYRWGPVFQQGYISGISPYGKADSPDEILLDVRTAKGMSGSPVFRPKSGEVIGIFNSAISSSGQSTTSFAIPLVKSVLEDWLTNFDESTVADESYEFRT